MSELEERLMDDYKAALRAGDTHRKETIRQLRSAVKSAAIDKRAPLTDEEVTQVLFRQAKQRRDSIEQFAQGGRSDLVKQEQAELAVIEDYLPRQLSREEVQDMARAAIDELAASGMRDMGKVMALLMSRVEGRADGKMVSDVVRGLLTER